MEKNPSSNDHRSFPFYIPFFIFHLLILHYMKWYHYVSCFFAGMFLTNAIPHLVNGISGDAFPTPFADPPGKGLSPPTLNVVWAFFNIIIGYMLYRGGQIRRENLPGIAIFIGGAIFAAIWLSQAFMEKM